MLRHSTHPTEFIILDDVASSTFLLEVVLDGLTFKHQRVIDSDKNDIVWTFIASGDSLAVGGQALPSKQFQLLLCVPERLRVPPGRRGYGTLFRSALDCRFEYILVEEVSESTVCDMPRFA